MPIPILSNFANSPFSTRVLFVLETRLLIPSFLESPLTEEIEALHFQKSIHFSLKSLSLKFKIWAEVNRRRRRRRRTKSRYGKDRDRGNGSMDKAMDFLWSLNHHSSEKNGSFPVLQRKAKYCAEMLMSVSHQSYKSGDFRWVLDHSKAVYDRNPMRTEECVLNLDGMVIVHRYASPCRRFDQ
ncbi:hypothetical protein Hanom_Chr14g01309161 [Helianthus anomalus]